MALLQERPIILSILITEATSYYTSWCSVLQCVAVCCSVLQCVVVCCSVLLQLLEQNESTENYYYKSNLMHFFFFRTETVTHLQHTATRCNTLQHANVQGSG